MARLLPILVFVIFNSLLLLSSGSQPASLKPNKLVLPVLKDKATQLFTTNIHKRTPPLQFPFVVHLNGKFLWVTCDRKYLSSTYQAPICHSTQCARATSISTSTKAPASNCFTCSSRARPGCHNNTCGLMTVNPITHQASMGELAQDVLSIQSSKGSNPSRFVSVPRFLFSCASSSLLNRGLPRNVQGVVGLGHAPISLPTQLASHFGFAPKFALCLPSSTSSYGAIFFGDGPYYMRPGNTDVSRPLSFTPLTISPRGKYHISVTQIRINNNPVPVDSALLTMNKQGRGGTKISTTKPFTVLEHSIFQSVATYFANELYSKYKVPQVKAVAPFGLCFDSRKLSSTRLGLGVPNIDLVLKNNQNVKWTIPGANSMVQAGPGVACLAFIDGGVRHRASMVIGAHQLQDNLLQFDLAMSMFGFSSSLLLRGTSCSNFNFTATSTTPLME
ncbi:hypothetical protein ACOSP7_009423 [Xanthoceras sorbifolium]|uniref:Peptidase A1 domain-containing protein n=1 Tax=Xanthoceras sorbifolium TaxID=99658 RepID=A0ABQ8HUW3_9ROSI|nr:hypothetical protein JRO89_XS07G0245900 [Xanthoceras sorbifolium]